MHLAGKSQQGFAALIAGQALSQNLRQVIGSSKPQALIERAQLWVTKQPQRRVATGLGCVDQLAGQALAALRRRH